MPRCWYGTKLSDVDPQPGHEVVMLEQSAGEGAKNFPSNRRGEPFTSLADEAFKSSKHCESPTGLTVQLWPNVHQHGISGRPSADGVAS